MTGPGRGSTGGRGAFALVLHSHLPWLAHHGRWPVGEEWLYQVWAASYLPVLDVLDDLAAEGRRDLLTLGVTPVLAAQLDDPYCVAAFSTWLGFWQARSEELAGDRDPALRRVAAHEFASASRAQAAHARRGALSTSFRRLADAGAIELLGGPATHAFSPLYPDDVVAAGLRVGRDDARLRYGGPRAGIWAPECGYRPGLERVYADEGVSHFVVDGPTFLRVGAETWAGRSVGESDVVAFARDLEVSYRVWSPRKGYPSDPRYRDFHTFHHGTGFRPARVTSTSTPPELKAPYEPAATAAVVRRDANDFVSVVVERLDDITVRRGAPGLVVAGFDTELFGHWWHEGPAWLAEVLRLLPAAGVEVTTLAAARESGYVDGPVELQAGSWGSGKDWRVWAGAKVADVVADNDRLVRRWRSLQLPRAAARDALADQIAREALLALSSDWAFMITKDSAAEYARARHDQHHRRFDELLRAHTGGPFEGAPTLSEARARDGLFGHLDARTLW
ncbi:MAG: 1,4-alpha-glucan branching protein domain-containing protein [Candidatus Nanopelagicales bacterium]